MTSTTTTKELSGKNILLYGVVDEVGCTVAGVALSMGANLVMLDQSQEKLEKIYDELIEQHGLQPNSERLAAYPLDVRRAGVDDYVGLRRCLEQEYQTIDSVIYNGTALCPPKSIAETDPDDWFGLFQANVHATWMIGRVLTKLMSGALLPRSIYMLDKLKGVYLGAYTITRAVQQQMMEACALEQKNSIVCAIDCSEFATHSNRYYFPGRLASDWQALNQLQPLIRQALLGERASLHGKILHSKTQLNIAS